MRCSDIGISDDTLGNPVDALDHPVPPDPTDDVDEDEDDEYDDDDDDVVAVDV